jgi:hypothetical protein
MRGSREKSLLLLCAFRGCFQPPDIPAGLAGNTLAGRKNIGVCSGR